jgi:hypothetical protein
MQVDGIFAAFGQRLWCCQILAAIMGSMTKRRIDEF